MLFKDTFTMGLRSLKERPLETGLLILGIALASCVSAAAILLQGSERIHTDKILQGPAYREIIVRSINNNEMGNQNQSLREVSQTDSQRIQLGDKDVAAVLEQVPQIAFSYKYSNETTRTGTAQGGFNMGPGQGQGPAPGQEPAPAASTNNTASASANSTNTAAPTATADRPNATANANRRNNRNNNAATDLAPPAANEGTANGRTPTATDRPAANGPGDAGPPQFDQGEDSPLAPGEVILETNVQSFRSLEASPGFFGAYGLEAGEGILFTDTDAQARAAMVVMGTTLAHRLFPEIEPIDLVGRKVRLNNRIFTISGILSDASGAISLANGSKMSDLAVTPATEIIIRNGTETIRFNRGNTTLRFAVSNIDQLEPATKALEQYFSATYGADKVSITVPWEEARLARDGFDRLLWIIVVFGSGAFVMALINLMNMMLTRSLRRQSALGILMAMGAARTDLMQLQAIEGMTMAIAGTLLGLLGALPLYNVLYEAGRNLFGITQGSVQMDIGVFVLTIPVMLIIAMAMAMIPAVMGARLSISTALKAE